MPQPTQYTPTTDFSQQEANNASGRSTVNTAALDAEFANIETTLDQTLSNLQLIQRDDGRLGDVTVEVRCLAPDVLNVMGGFNLTGLWTPATAYAVNDICSNGEYTYVCKTAHTSGGSFSATNWVQFGFTSGADAAQAAANAQASAAAALVSENNSSGHASSASASASSAASSAASAASSASSATSSASAASSSATSASNSASAAAASAASISFPVPVASGGTGATNATGARSALGLGTAATLNVGTGANNVVQLDGTGKLPAVNGSQLTNLPVEIPSQTGNSGKYLTTNGTAVSWATVALSGGAGSLKPFVTSASAAYTPAAGETLSRAHGLGFAPTSCQLVFECVVADAGYAVGERTYPVGVWNGTSTFFLGMYSDATNCYVKCSPSVWVFIVNRTTGNAVTPTANAWKYYFVGLQ